MGIYFLWHQSHITYKGLRFFLHGFFDEKEQFLLICAKPYRACPFLCYYDAIFAVSKDSMSITKLPLILENNKIIWPKQLPKTGTLLLGISVKSSLGRICTPALEINYEKATLSIQLPSKLSHSMLYCELSSWLDKQIPEKAMLSLKLHGATLASNEAQLYYYPNDQKFLGKKTLVVAPHPDDAEIAAFGLYSKRESAILTVTAGEAGFNPYSAWFKEEAATSFKARLRVFDSLTAPLWGGVAKDCVANLGYADNGLSALKKGEKAKEFLWRDFHKPAWLPQQTVPSWFSLLKDIEAAIAQWQPEVIAMPHYRYDAHPDHNMTTRAVLEVLSTSPGSVKGLLFYINHAAESAAYPWGESKKPRALYAHWVEDTKGFYTHIMDEEQQVNKLFALDLMHDLRYPPKTKTSFIKSVFHKAWRKWDPYRSRTSFYRKAIRSSELFWAYSITDLPFIIESLPPCA